MAVIIFGFWNVPVVRNLINPLKLFTIGWHELCHISAVCIQALVVFLHVLIVSTGNPHRWTNTQNHYRPPCRRGNNRRRRCTRLCSVIGLYWLDITRWGVYSRRMEHISGQSVELCVGSWARTSSGSGQR